MAKSCEFAVNAPISPFGVLVSKADDQSADLGVNRWASCFLGGRLGPVSCDESTVPLQHGFGSDDQERQAAALAVDCTTQERKDCSVSLVELRAVDLALQDEDLMP